jgi:ribosomal protein S18 acetylase RimI-like enzyme
MERKTIMADTCGISHSFRRKVQRDDTLLSNFQLTHAVGEIMKNVRLDRTWDIPYLAGYSLDGKTVYIDRHLPRTYRSHGRTVRVDPFLILHESVEKALVDHLRLHYQHAHQIALRAEQAAVAAAGLSWHPYNSFMMKFVKHAAHEKLCRVPENLHLKPYWDEKDTALIRNMQQAMPRNHKEKMIFRKAHLDDVEAIEQIEHRSFGRAEERFHRRQIASLVGNPRAIVLIAQDGGGKHLGWGAALVRRHGVTKGKSPARSGRIYAVAVDPDGRGMGVGQKLMTEMLDQLRRGGAKRVFLEVRDDNVVAIGLYHKLGFVDVARLDHYYATNLHALRMMLE